MAGHAPLQLYVYAVDDNDRPAVLDAIAELGLDPGSGTGETGSRRLAIGRCYRADEALIHSSHELASLLQETAPSAVFTLWQDPYMDTDGHFVAHVPDVGRYETGCDATGTPHVDVIDLTARLNGLSEGTAVREWLSGDGDSLLGLTVLAALHQHKESCGM